MKYAEIHVAYVSKFGGSGLSNADYLEEDELEAVVQVDENFLHGQETYWKD